MTARIDDRQRSAINRIAALVLVNAMMFQEVLAQRDERVRPLQDLEHEPDLIAAFASHWKFILDDINYFPIFNVAHQLLLCLAADPGVTEAVKHLAGVARRIVGWRASLRHDLAGRIYHRLLVEAKYLGAYYTSIPSAVLLAKLALNPDDWAVGWSDEADLKGFRIGDLACGTGTLLMAAADVVADNYIRACNKAGETPQLTRLQQIVVEHMLSGLDVIASAVHLTASTLSLRVPDVPINVTNLSSLELGAEHDQLGSLEFLDSGRVTGTLFAELPRRVRGRGEPARQAIVLPMFDLCIMNPPFTSSRQPNLLFGSLPRADRARLQKKLKKIVSSNKVQASITAGLAAVFVALGDKYLKNGGRLALVLPRAILSGVAWEKTRGLMNSGYVVEYVIVSHEADHWNFSENTDLSEVLLVARKVDSQERHRSNKVVCVNLWHNPRSPVEALALARTLIQGSPPEIQRGKRTQGALQLNIGGLKFGEVVSVRWPEFRKSLWLHPCAFAQSELVRTAYALLDGRLDLPGRKGRTKLRLCPLRNIAELGPDPRDVYDAFEVTSSKTAYPTLWGAKGISRMEQEPNAYLEPLAKAREGRNLRKVEALWPRAGRVLLTQRPRLSTKALAAVRVDREVLAQVWWPLRIGASGRGKNEAEKALVLWLNSTIGLLILFAHREETEGAWVQFKKPVLEGMPVVDVLGIPRRQLKQLASAFDRLSGEQLLAYPHMSTDPIRAAIDKAVAHTLGLPDFSVLRELLSREPIICLTMDRLTPPSGNAQGVLLQ